MPEPDGGQLRRLPRERGAFNDCRAERERQDADGGDLHAEYCARGVEGGDALLGPCKERLFLSACVPDRERDGRIPASLSDELGKHSRGDAREDVVAVLGGEDSVADREPRERGRTPGKHVCHHKLCIAGICELALSERARSAGDKRARDKHVGEEEVHRHARH